MKKLLFGILAALLLVATLSYTQDTPQTPAPPAPGMGPGMGMGRGPGMAMDDDDDDDMLRGPGMGCMRGLELTDAQEAKFLVMQRDHQRKMVELRSDLAGQKGKMMLLLTDESFDKKKVSEMIEKKADIEKKLALEKVTFMRSIRDQLDIDQKVVFDRNIMMMHKGGRGMGGHGMGMSMGGGKGMGCDGGPCGKGPMDGPRGGCRR